MIPLLLLVAPVVLPPAFLVAPAILSPVFFEAGVPVLGVVRNSATGAGVAGAIVVLQGEGEQPDSYVARAGDDGRFRMEDVAPGRYQIKPQQIGYTAPTRIQHLTVASGQAVPDITIRLTPLGAISGRTLDIDGDPIARVKVEALRYTYADGNRRLTSVETATTDDRGNYRIFGLPPGRYYLRCSDTARFLGATLFTEIIGPRPATDYAAVYFPSATDPAGAVALDLPAGADLTGNDFRQPTKASYTVHVTVSGVERSDAYSVDLRGSTGFSAGMVRTLQGELLFPRMASGTYQLTLRTEKTGLAARRVFQVSNSDLNFDLALKPVVNIAGSVHGEHSGKLQVRLANADSFYDSQATEGADGAFLLKDVQPVPYLLRVTPPLIGYVKSVEAAGKSLAASHLDGAKLVGPLTITIANDGGTVEGAVVDAQGSPVDGATVVFVPESDLGDWTHLLKSATTDDAGAFAVHDLAPGSYRAYAWEDAEEGAPLNAEFRKPFEAQSVIVQIAPNSHQKLQLKSIKVSR